MFNKVILTGHLTRDIEKTTTANGTAVAKTAIATTRTTTSNGAKKEETCFIDITMMGGTAEVAIRYLRKGSKLLVEGRLQFEQWVDKTSGQKRSKHSLFIEGMEMLGSANEGRPSEANNNQSSGGSSYEAPRPALVTGNGKGKGFDDTEIGDIQEDEIPF